MAVAFAFGAGLEVSKELERRDGWEVDKSKDNLESRRIYWNQRIS